MSIIAMEWFIQNFIIDELHNKKYNPDAGLFQAIKNSSVANNIDNQTLVILSYRVFKILCNIMYWIEFYLMTRSIIAESEMLLTSDVRLLSMKSW